MSEDPYNLGDRIMEDSSPRTAGIKSPASAASRYRLKKLRYNRNGSFQRANVTSATTFVPNLEKKLDQVLIQNDPARKKLNEENKIEDQEDEDARRMKKTRLCPFFFKFRLCKNGDKCPYAHNPNDLDGVYHPNVWVDRFINPLGFKGKQLEPRPVSSVSGIKLSPRGHDNGLPLDKIIDKMGKTRLLHFCAANNIESAKEELLAGANPIQQDFKGNDSICYAIINNESNLLETILSFAAIPIDINKPLHNNDESYLIIAAKRGNPHLLRVLLNHGANPNYVDDKGKSALFFCIEKNNPIAIDILSDAGANISLAQNDGLAPLDIAFKQKKDDILIRLIRHGAMLGDSAKKRELLFYACFRNQPLMIHELFKRGVLTDERDPEGNTILMACYSQKKYELCKLLIREYNLEHLLVLRNNNNENILLRCCQDLNYEMLEYFMQFPKFELNERYAHEKTVLMHAAAGNNPTLVQLLMDHGANPDLQDKFGRTSLIIAVKHENQDVVKTLLQYRVDSLSRDLNRKNAYDYAQMDEIREMLRSYMLNTNQISDKLSKELEKQEFQNLLKKQEQFMEKKKTRKLDGIERANQTLNSAAMHGDPNNAFTTLGLLGEFYTRIPGRKKGNSASKPNLHKSALPNIKSYLPV